jgi:hypothetical protein
MHDANLEGLSCSSPLVCCHGDGEIEDGGSEPICNVWIFGYNPKSTSTKATSSPCYPRPTRPLRDVVLHAPHSVTMFHVTRLQVVSFPAMALLTVVLSTSSSSVEKDLILFPKFL